MTSTATYLALSSAINDRDATRLQTVLAGIDFILINIEDDQDEDDENIGALTAQIDDYDALVAFTSEDNASEFVQSMGELFDTDDEIEGFMVEGSTLLEFLPEGFGLLLNPESEQKQIVDVALANLLIAATGEK